MSLKRLPINWWIRLKNGANAGRAMMLGLVTLASFILWAIGISRSLVISISLIIFIISILTAYIKGRMMLIPDVFIDELSSEGKYVANYCESQRLKEACELTKLYYRHEYVPEDIAACWRMKNPKGFVQITNSNGMLCAAFGVFALSKSFMEQFIEGNVTDTQLREDNILDYKESKYSNDLYISGVIVRDPLKYNGRKRVGVMLWSMLIYLKKLYSFQQVRFLYALAVTPESEKLLNKLDFQSISMGVFRKDKCNLYKYEMTKESWGKLLLQVGDHSLRCECNFSKSKT